MWSVHVPPLIQGEDSHSLYSYSQCSPANPVTPNSKIISCRIYVCVLFGVRGKHIICWERAMHEPSDGL
jgi:hypothetical protein